MQVLQSDGVWFFFVEDSILKAGTVFLEEFNCSVWLVHKTGSRCIGRFFLVNFKMEDQLETGFDVLSSFQAEVFYSRTRSHDIKSGVNSSTENYTKG